MDQVHVIRHKVLVEGRSARQVAKELGISRRTVRKYVTEAVPIRTEAQPPPRLVWEAVRARIEQLLSESVQWTARKQRLTATRLHELLVAKGQRVGVTLVKEAVAEWKRQRREVFVPLTYRPGDLAEVGFFEVLVDVDARAARRGFSDAADVLGPRLRLDLRAGQPPRWPRARLRAFRRCPARVAYENLKAAVVRILVGGERAPTARFAALASHYLSEPCFCRPGESHDKGGVEARGKALRQQALVPIPIGPRLDPINAALLARLDTRLDTKRDVAGQTIGARFLEEALARNSQYTKQLRYHGSHRVTCPPGGEPRSSHSRAR